jgi:hypothetical protein
MIKDVFGGTFADHIKAVIGLGFRKLTLKASPVVRHRGNKVW